MDEEELKAWKDLAKEQFLGLLSRLEEKEENGS